MVLSHTQKNIFRLTTMQIFYMSTLAKFQRADLKSCMGVCVCSWGNA